MDIFETFSKKQPQTEDKHTSPQTPTSDPPPTPPPTKLQHSVEENNMEDDQSEDSITQEIRNVNAFSNENFGYYIGSSPVKYFKREYTEVEEENPNHIKVMKEQWEQQKTFLLSRLEFYEKEAKYINTINNLYSSVPDNIYHSTVFYKDVNDIYIAKDEVEEILKDNAKYYRSIIRLSILGNILFTSYVSGLIISYFKYYK